MEPSSGDVNKAACAVILMLTAWYHFLLSTMPGEVFAMWLDISKCLLAIVQLSAAFVIN